MSPLQQYAVRVLRRWPVILVVAMIGAALSAVWSLSNAETSWTATTALTTQSQTRGPDQDAVLALGYVDYFNQDGYQSLLSSQASIPDGVKLSAMTGATSPILYIEATAKTEDVARDAAAKATEQFRQDVRDSLVAERQQAVLDIQGEIDVNTKRMQALVDDDIARGVVADQVRSLQGRLTDIQADNTNLLKPLQPVPGVASSTPSPMMDIATGTLGAALLGVLLALLLVVCDRRIRTGADVKQRLGFPTLLDLDGKVDPDVRVRQMQHFANSLRLVAGSDTAVVAVVGVRQSMRSAELAQGLAATASSRRSGAILICADLNADLPKEAEGRRGLVEVLGGQMNARAATIAGAGGLAILPAGNAAGRDPYGLFDPERMVGVVEEVSRGRHFVVIDAPAVLDATESQIVCAAADRVVVVIERGATRWADLKQAVALLGDVRAQVAGVAIVEPAPRKRPEQAEPAEPDGMVEHAPTYTNGTANHPAPPEARTETLQHVTPAPDPRPRPVSVGSASGNGQNRATDGTGNG